METGDYLVARAKTVVIATDVYKRQGRTRVEWVSAAEGVKFSQTMNEFVEKITSLGRNVRLEDLRCRN